MRKRRVSLLGVVALAGAGGVLAHSHVKLQQPLNALIAADKRNKGIVAWCHYRAFIPGHDLVFDLREVQPDKSPNDVLRVLLGYASSLKESAFTKVWLQHRGVDKFFLDGHYFQQLGREFGIQNPVYTIRTLPEHVRRPDGSAAFPQWTGGLLGVLGKQLEDVNRFHREWYVEDL